MKKTVLLSALALVAGAVLLRLLQHDAGYVLIVGWGKTIEVRLGFALILLLLTLFACYLIWRFSARTAHLFKSGWSSSINARARKKNRKLEQGLHSMLVGDWAHGQRALIAAARLSKNPQLEYYAAARCAHAQNDNEVARKYLHKAEHGSERVALTALLLEAQILREEKNYAACIALLNQAKSTAPESEAVLKQLHEVYRAQEDWQAIEALMPELEKRHVYQKEVLKKHQLDLYFARLGEFGKKIETAEQSVRPAMLDEVEAYWARLPKSFKHDPVLIERYCHILLLTREERKAESLIKTALKTDWQPALVQLYGVLQNVDAREQLQQVEYWQKQHPDDAALELAAGRICLRNELWGQARTHFEKSIALQPDPVAYAELARLLSYLGESAESLDIYRKGLLYSANSLPNLPHPQRQLV